MSQITTTDYAKLLTEIKVRIRTAQYEALKAVNKELISLYWASAKQLSSGKKANPGGSRWSSDEPKIYNKSFQESAGFLLPIFGE